MTWTQTLAAVTGLTIGNFIFYGLIDRKWKKALKISVHMATAVLAVKLVYGN